MKEMRKSFLKKSIFFIAILVCMCTASCVFCIAAETEYSITTTNDVFFVGSDIEFEFSGSKSASDWVGICKSEVKSYRDDNFGIWLYLGTGQTGDVAPVTDVITSGKYSLKAVKDDGTNLPAGEYSLVFMSDDSFNEVARCNFKIIDLPIASSIPKVENISISDDNQNLKFSMPESCSVNDGYSVLLFWADKEFKSIGETPFYSFDLSDKSSVELSFANLESKPENAESINVYLAQYGVMSESYESVKLNTVKTFIPLVIPESEKSFSTDDHIAEKGKKIFNFLSDFSIWIILVSVVIGIALIVTFKFKKTQNKAEKNEF